jgi:5-methylcytosine-specific restriction endonuclease McrA
MSKTKKQKTPQTSENFDLRSFIVKELRRAFKRAPMYREAKAKAKEEYFEKSKNGKDLRRVRFKCAECGRSFVDRKGAKNIAVDHINPVIDLKEGWVNYEVYVKRLFCSMDNLQVLCNYKGEIDGVKSCHKIKTANERAEMAKNRKENK